MEKTVIDSFIKKYTLNGLIEQVRWISKDKKLETKAITPDRKLVVEVSLNKFEAFEDAEVGIVDTSKLKSILNAIGEKVEFTLNVSEEETKRVTSMVVSDSKVEAVVVAADLDILPKVPQLKTLPVFGVEIKLTEDFISNFMKCKAALSEVDLFTLVMSKKRNRLEMVLGFSKNNVNRIALEVPTEGDKNKVSKPLNFSAKSLKEIISANPECKDSILKVSEDGMMFVECVSGDISSKYYLVQIDTED